METIKLDEEKLQKAAEEAAMKGAIDAIKEYYSGYNSPYKKQITKELEDMSSRGISNFELPNIMASIGEAMKSELERLKNSVIAETFTPLVNSLFLEVPVNMSSNEFLKHLLVECAELKHVDFDDITTEWKKHDRHDWIDVNVTFYKDEEQLSYDFTLHTVFRKENTFQLLSLHGLEKFSHRPNIKIKKGDVTVELPMSKTNLEDPILLCLTKMIIGKVEITYDGFEPDEDWFERDECHC